MLGHGTGGEGLRILNRVIGYEPIALTLPETMQRGLGGSAASPAPQALPGWEALPWDCRC